MNAAHIHLLLNHFPTVGFSIGLGLFVVAIFAKKEVLKQTSLVIFFMIAALSITTYVSGNDAQDAIKDQPGVSAPLIEAHESAALVAFVFMQATGFFSWIALWLQRRVSRVANWNLVVVLALSIVTFALMARAANFGGEIRHAEIQDAHESFVASTGPTLAKSWSLFVQSNSWVWPTCETVHFIGLSMLFAVVLVVDLRMLGFGLNNRPVSELARDVFPWFAGSLIVMLVSGVALLFIKKRVNACLSSSETPATGAGKSALPPPDNSTMHTSSERRSRTVCRMACEPSTPTLPGRPITRAMASSEPTRAAPCSERKS